MNGGAGHRRYTRCGFVAGSWRVVLPRAGGALGRAGAGRAGRAVGAGLGRHRHQRRLASAAIGRAHPASHRAAAGAPPPRPAHRRAAGRPRPLVAGVAPAGARAGPARPRAGAVRGAARPPRRRHPRGRPGRGAARRLLLGLRRAAADGGGRPLPARLLRRGAGRRTVRTAGRRRAAARRPRPGPGGRRHRRAGRRRPRQPLRRDHPLAGSRPQAGPRGRRLGGARVRAPGAVRRARRARPGRRSIRSCSSPAIEALASLVRDGRVKRLAIERIDGEPVAGTEAERLLVAHGFLQAPRRVVLRA